MERKTKKKRYILLKLLFAAAIFWGAVYYAYSFPRTMELLDKAVNGIAGTVGIDAEFDAFSDFSDFSKKAVEKAFYFAEVIKENIEGNLPEGKALPFAVITCAAEFPSEGETVTSGFGERISPISGKSEMHTGIDIAAAFGSDVKAAWPGKITETGFDEIYGNYVIIEHSEGFFTKYCHLSAVSTEKNAFVKSGEKIGEAGSTGRSTGSHLHFEVLVGGRNIDPKECLEL